MNRHTWITRSIRALWCTTVLVLAACGGGGDDPPPAPPPTVGAAGGTVTGPNGAQVVVPASALAADTAIAVTQSSSGAPALPAGVNALGDMFAFTPHGTTFGVPVTVTVPFNAAALPPGATPLLYKTNAAGAWEQVGNAAINAGTLVAQVSSFSWMIVGNLPPQITSQPTSVSVVEPATASFSVSALGTPPFTHQWQRSDDGGATFNDIPSATASTYTTGATSVAADNGDRYRVLVGNLEGVATSSSATLTVTANVISPTGVSRIAAGSDFSFARRANGDAYSWGSDNAGTLGAGNGDQSRNVPGAVLASNITSVSAGGAHGIAVRGTGEVRGWGYNGFGQLGDGSTLTREGPTSALLGGTTQYADAVEVCGGTLHSLVRRANGTVQAMGAHNFGQLGDGTPADPTGPGRTSSVAVQGITTATAIACRGNHSLALLADGTVRAWGWNDAGQLGDGTNTTRSAPVVVAGLGNVIAIAAGQDFSLALRSDGSVWAWGSNVNGKLGDGNTLNRLAPVATLLTSQITAIAAGSMNALALRSDGVVLSWGINETGQLGSGSLSPGFRPQPGAVTGLTGVTAIAFGTGSFGHGLALRSDGTLWAWGHNNAGQLGNGSTAPFSATPVQVSGLNLN